MASGRRRARILALQTLYEVDTVGHVPEETLGRLLAQTTASEEVEAFARELVKGVLENRKRIDEVIAQAAPAYPVSQLAAIDRNILRLAIHEILINNETPVRAAINEAVELAKRFGSDNSARFVNGVLGSVSAMAAGEQAAGASKSGKG
jgi:N utilization substance protein B